MIFSYLFRLKILKTSDFAMERFRVEERALVWKKQTINYQRFKKPIEISQDISILNRKYARNSLRPRPCS